MLGTFGQVQAEPGKTEKPSKLRTCCPRPLLLTPVPGWDFLEDFSLFPPKQAPVARHGAQLSACTLPKARRAQLVQQLGLSLNVIFNI